jgi:hypothetical protein
MFKRLVVFAFLFVLMNVAIAYAVEKAERITDREIIERLIRLEEGQKALNQRIDDMNNSVNKRFDDINNKIDDIKTFMLWGFGILFGGMGLLMGFVIWDRRTALAPAVKRTKEIEEQLDIAVKKVRELEERESRLEAVIKEYAQQEPRFAEILKTTKLL